MAKKASFPNRPCPKCGKPIHIKAKRHEECGWVADEAAAAQGAPSTKAAPAATKDAETTGAYFRRVFKQNRAWLKGCSNDEVLKRWLADHPGHTDVPDNIKKHLSRVLVLTATTVTRYTSVARFASIFSFPPPLSTRLATICYPRTAEPPMAAEHFITLVRAFRKLQGVAGINVSCTSSSPPPPRRGHPTFLEQLAAAPTLNPATSPASDAIDLDTVIEEPPDMIVAPPAVQKPWLSRRARRVDFVERDAANRQLGKLGEQFTVQLEQHRLRSVGRDDLARKVELVSVTTPGGEPSKRADRGPLQRPRSILMMARRVPFNVLAPGN
jgi:hypothetical protein